MDTFIIKDEKLEYYNSIVDPIFRKREIIVNNIEDYQDYKTLLEYIRDTKPKNILLNYNHYFDNTNGRRSSIPYIHNGMACLGGVKLPLFDFELAIQVGRKVTIEIHVVTNVPFGCCTRIDVNPENLESYITTLAVAGTVRKVKMLGVVL